MRDTFKKLCVALVVLGAGSPAGLSYASLHLNQNKEKWNLSYQKKEKWKCRPRNWDFIDMTRQKPEAFCPVKKADDSDYNRVTPPDPQGLDKFFRKTSFLPFQTLIVWDVETLLQKYPFIKDPYSNAQRAVGVPSLESSAHFESIFETLSARIAESCGSEAKGGATLIKEFKELIVKFKNPGGESAVIPVSENTSPMLHFLGQEGNFLVMCTTDQTTSRQKIGAVADALGYSFASQYEGTGTESLFSTTGLGWIEAKRHREEGGLLTLISKMESGLFNKVVVCSHKPNIIKKLADGWGEKFGHNQKARSPKFISVDLTQAWTPSEEQKQQIMRDYVTLHDYDIIQTAAQDIQSEGEPPLKKPRHISQNGLQQSLLLLRDLSEEQPTEFLHLIQGNHEALLNDIRQTLLDGTKAFMRREDASQFFQRCQTLYHAYLFLMLEQKKGQQSVIHYRDLATLSWDTAHNIASKALNFFYKYVLLQGKRGLLCDVRRFQDLQDAQQ